MKRSYEIHYETSSGASLCGAAHTVTSPYEGDVSCPHCKNRIAMFWEEIRDRARVRDLAA